MMDVAPALVPGRMMDMSSLHVAVRKGAVAVVRQVLEERAGRGEREVKEVLGARDPFGNTPLHYAAEGHPDIVALLLSCGPRLLATDARNNEGSTPLHHGSNELALPNLLHPTASSCLFQGWRKWKRIGG